AAVRLGRRTWWRRLTPRRSGYRSAAGCIAAASGWAAGRGRAGRGTAAGCSGSRVPALGGGGWGHAGQVIQRSRRELRGPVLVQDPLGPAAAGCVVADQDADVGDEHRNR